MSPLKLRFLTFVALVLCALCTQAWSDDVVLNDGTTYRGKKTGEAKDAILFRTEDGKVRILRKQDIKSYSADASSPATKETPPDEGAPSAPSPAGTRILAKTGREIYAVAIAPDGRQALSGGKEAFVRLWDLATRREIRRFNLNGMPAFSVAFSPDGRRVAASGGARGPISVWEKESGKLVRNLPGQLEMTPIAFSPDGKKILTAVAEGGEIPLWDVETGQKTRVYRRRPQGDMLLGYIMDTASSPDGTMVASAGRDGRISVWETETGTILGEGVAGEFGGVGHSAITVAFSADSKLVVCGSEDGAIRVYRARDNRTVAQMAIKGAGVTGTRFTPDGRYVVSGSGDGTVRVWRIADAIEVHQWKATGGVGDLEISSDGSFVLSGSWDGTIQVWDFSEAIRAAEKQPLPQPPAAGEKPPPGGVK